MAVSPLHVVADAIPCEVGYTLRTQSLVVALHAAGVAPAVVSLRTPGIRGLVRTHGSGVGEFERGGVRYFQVTEERKLQRYWAGLSAVLRHHNVRGAWRFGRDLPALVDGESQYQFVRAVARACPEINVIHGHTPSKTAGVGLRVARELGLPFIYEVRGFWDLTSETTGASARIISQHKVGDRFLATEADAVVTLGTAMRDELVGRGIPAERIHIVPNGVREDLTRKELRPDRRLKGRMELDGRFVVGCVTSVRRLEGIATLLKAVQILLERGMPVSALIVGSGDALDDLKSVSQQLKVHRHIHFVGKVPHRQVLNYYSLMDAFVLPRINAAVCRIVTPLKLLEPMALGIPVVVSDLPALREFVEPNVRGLCFEAENPDDLAAQIGAMVESPALRSALADNARCWVKAERTWDAVADRCRGVYQMVLEERLSPTAS